MRMNWRLLALATVLLVVVEGVSAGAQERSFELVTDAMLQHPDPADWLNCWRTLDG